MDQGQAVIRPAGVTDLPNIEAVARTTWPVAYAGIIPDEVQRRLLDSWYSTGALGRADGLFGPVAAEPAPFCRTGF